MRKRIVIIILTVLLAPLLASCNPEVWSRVAQCESGGRWDLNTGNGYHGGLQFHPTTWINYGGREFATYAYQASALEQMIIAERVLAREGWGAWPHCSSKLGLR
jgi:resuscitation-promoting factor RpfA